MDDDLPQPASGNIGDTHILCQLLRSNHHPEMPFAIEDDPFGGGEPDRKFNAATVKVCVCRRRELKAARTALEKVATYQGDRIPCLTARAEHPVGPAHCDQSVLTGLKRGIPFANAFWRQGTPEDHIGAEPQKIGHCYNHVAFMALVDTFAKRSAQLISQAASTGIPA